MSKPIEELLKSYPTWETVLKEDGYIDEDNRITIKEAFASPDAPLLFPKVMSRTLKEAAEPQLLVTPLLSVVRLGKGRSAGFPAVNAIQAAEIPEGQEFPEQALAFAEQVEGKVSKKGVKVVFTEEVILDSLWDIVGLHVRAAGRAMARLREQIALSRFADVATVVFDNDGAERDTTGVGADGNPNDSMSWDDVLDMATVLIGESKSPTDIIMHPLMWSVFLKGASFTNGGQNFGAAWGINLGSREGVVNATSPFGLNVILSPYVNYTPGTPPKSDIFLIDRNEIGVFLAKDDMSTDEWNDPTRDIRSLKLKERYDIVMLGQGQGVAVAKNVALTKHYEISLSRTIA